MQTKLKVHRDRVVIYYSNNKQVFRERTPVYVSNKDKERVNKSLSRNSIPSSIEREMIPVLERKAYCDSILTHIIKTKNRAPSVPEFKKLLNKNPKNLNETRVIPLLEEFNELTEKRFTKGTFSKSSLKDYTSFLNMIKDYELDKEVVLDYSDLNEEFVEELYGFMLSERVNTVEKQYRTLGRLKGSTMKKRFDNLKFFTKWLKKKLKVNVHEEVKSKIATYDFTSEELNPPVKRYALDREGMEALWEVEPETKNERMAKDIFLVSCYTSLRFSDLITLGKRHLKSDTKEVWIEKKAVKTNADMVIPLKNEIIDLLEAYEYNLDRLSNGMLNKSLKKLLAKSDYFQADSQFYKADGTLYKLYEIISCHTGRRTMISRLLNEFNIPPSRVMKVSGHKSLKSLNKYIVSDKLGIDVNLL